MTHFVRVKAVMSFAFSLLQAQEQSFGTLYYLLSIFLLLEFLKLIQRKLHVLGIVHVQYWTKIAYSYFKKCVIVHSWYYMYNQKELWVQWVIMSDYTPEKVEHYCMVIELWSTRTLYFAKSILIVIDYLWCLKPTAPFGSSIDYRLTMTTFFEVAVYMTAYTCAYLLQIVLFIVMAIQHA